MPQKALFNPLPDDVIVTMFDDHNQSTDHLLKAQEITWVGTAEYPVLRQHLANAVFNVEGNSKRDHDLEMKDIFAKIEVPITHEWA